MQLDLKKMTKINQMKNMAVKVHTLLNLLDKYAAFISR